MTVRDLYAKKDLGLFTHNFTAVIPYHGVLALKLTPSKCAPYSNSNLCCKLDLQRSFILYTQTDALHTKAKNERRDGLHTLQVLQSSHLPCQSCCAVSSSCMTRSRQVPDCTFSWFSLLQCLEFCVHV